jgi:hypothetical protein
VFLNKRGKLIADTPVKDGKMSPRYKQELMMPQYIFVYLGGEYPASPQEGEAHFMRYQEWLRSLGDAVISPAIPFKDTHTVHPTGEVEAGTTTMMSGLSIIQMPSMEAALEAAKSCPFREINGTLEISELIEMTGAPEDGAGDKLN